MKGYFNNEYSNDDKLNDIEQFLKSRYDEADEIFGRRFDGAKAQEVSTRISELESGIWEVNKRIESENYNAVKLSNLTLGHLYLRLGQCQSEQFLESKKSYQKAISYFGESVYIDLEDEIELLLLLNIGDYFRNTAQIGRKKDYEKACDAFQAVEVHAWQSQITPEKKLHIILDAKINIGRVKRYSYDFKEANAVFLSLIQTLKCYVDEGKQKKIEKCTVLMKELNSTAKDAKVVGLLDAVRTETTAYVFEYILQALIHIGIIYRKQRNYRDAITIFELVQKIDSKENTDALNNLGVCCRKRYSGDYSDPGKRQKALSEAEKIFEGLKEKGNRFATVNLYKCRLGMNDEEKFRESLKFLEENYRKNRNLPMSFLLGQFYEKDGQYENAEGIFQEVYNQQSHIARGSVGFKAYYHLAQCKICRGNYVQARNILGTIREYLKKYRADPDILTEIDFGWCLMQEGNYEEAVRVYKPLAKKTIKNLGNHHWMQVRNNLSECYIHLGKEYEARQLLLAVQKLDSDNTMARYLLAGLNLKELQTDTPCSLPLEKFESVYDDFTKLLRYHPIELGASAGWLISAILLFDKCTISGKIEAAEKIKTVIVHKLKYQIKPITMKSYVYLAGFLLKQLENDNDHPDESLYKEFCHVNLVEVGENRAFCHLMNSPGFHFFEICKRAELLADIVQMYDHVMRIKNECRYTYADKTDSSHLPVHYTKLDVLKLLLMQPEGEKSTKKPRLRLWNTAYMNDSYEGSVFEQLLSRAACHDLNKSSKWPEQKKKEAADILNRYLGNCVMSDERSGSNVYITSFSKEPNSFQMWNIYADKEKGVAIRFEDDFFDIRDAYQDSVMDAGVGEYSLYEVQYCKVPGDESETGFSVSGKLSEEVLWNSLKQIWIHLRKIDGILHEIEMEIDKEEEKLFAAARAEIQSFITDRLNEIRFLFKTLSYEYESEMRIICCSHKSRIDETNFDIPRLYIEVEKEIDNLSVQLGSKLDKNTIKEIKLWLNNTNKVKGIDYQS